MFSRLIDENPIFELVVPRSLALTVFRLVPPITHPVHIAATPKPDQAQPISMQEKILISGVTPKVTTTCSDCPLKSTQSAQSKANALNRAFYTRISARKTLLLTQTDLSGIFCIRFAVGAILTEAMHIREAVEVLNEEAQATLKEWGEQEQ